MNSKAHALLLIPLAFMVSIPFANAQSDRLKQRLLQCSELGNDARLACVDKLIAELTADNNVAKAETPIKPKELEKAEKPKKQVSVAQKVEKDDSQEARFGVENKQPKQQIERIEAEVTEIKERRLRDDLFILDNGQVWAKKDSSRLRVYEGDTIYIERAALGAFFLGKDGQNLRTKVDRVR